MKKKIQKFDKILVANRGEIALRIMRSLKKMGIRTVAIYSEADTNSLHVQYADEAIYIGPSPATESYLSIKNVMKAVRSSGAQAVHPGYGFLSENPQFAKALRSERVKLIGPSVEAIQKMGDKVEAKRLAQEAGVNTIPGYMGIIQSAEEAINIARDIGLPIIIKAAAGGGGRGMRVIYNEDEIVEAFRSASSEAKNSFNDERVFIEKYIEDPRHIEIQILADKFGNVVCLGERECTIQRHHQKVIEEAPSPFIDETTRQNMYQQCIALAKKVDYYSAGTVEFIVDKHKNFYFLEMNTRLQVEHCVTEMVTGIDIVEQMVCIARNEELSFTQADIKLTGWALESRIYAEDPSRGFIPSSGRITQYQEPVRSTNVRIDRGIYEGGEVSMFYDAMIVKLCTYGNDRKEAIEHMQKALGDFIIRGISHNISFLEAVMSHPRFQSGDITTKFIEEEYPQGFSGAELTSDMTRIFLCVALHIYLTDAKRAAAMNGQLSDRSRYIGTRWVVTLDDLILPVLSKEVEGGYNIRYESERLSIRSDWVLGNRLFKGVVGGKNISVRIDYYPGGYYLTHGGIKVRATVRSPRVAELEKFMPPPSNRNKSNQLTSPLSGVVVMLKVSPGDEVKAGQEVGILSAMKMENIIYSEISGTVSSIHAKDGDNVEMGQVLIEFELDN